MAAAPPAPLLAPGPQAAGSHGGWQNSEADADLRQEMTDSILEVFTRKRGNNGGGWGSRLHEFVSRLEEQLYHTAGSKEEYANLTTLEQRLQQLARQMQQPSSADPNSGNGLPPAATGQQPLLMGAQGSGMHPHQQGPPQGGGLQGGQMGSVPPPQHQAAQAAGLPPGMMPNPGHPSPNMGNSASTGMPYQGPGPGQGQGPVGLPGFIPTSGTNGRYPGQLDDLRGLPSQGMLQQQQKQQQHQPPQQHPGMQSPGMPDMGGGPRNSHAGATMGYGGMPGQQAAMQHPGMGGPRTSLNGMASDKSLGQMPGSMQGFVPTPGMGPPHGGMMPMGGGMLGQTPGMLGMSGSASLAPAPGSGMVPMPGMMHHQQGGPYGGMAGMNGMNGMNGMPPSMAGMNGMNGMPASMGGMNGVPHGMGGVNGMPPGMNGMGSGMGHMSGAGGMNGMAGVNGMPPGMNGVNGMPPSLGAMNSLGLGLGLGGPGGQQLSDPAHLPNGAPAPMIADPNEMSAERKAQYVQKQQRWLLFLRHCAKCRAADTECQLAAQCKFGKQLWQHILHCNVLKCPYPRCANSKDLLKHHQKCTSATCPICAPVKDYVRKTRLQQSGNSSGSVPPGTPTQSGPPPSQPPMPQQAMPQPPMQQQRGPPHGMGPSPNMPAGMMPGMQGVIAPPPPPYNGAGLNAAGSLPQPGQKRQVPQPQYPTSQPPAMPAYRQPTAHAGPSAAGPYAQQQAAAEHTNKRHRGDPTAVLTRNTYTSLLETFSVDMIRLHKELIYTASAAQRTAQATQAAAAEQSDLCKVCGCSKLLYEPPVLYCSQCGLKIKRTQTYWASPPEQQDKLKGCWCHTCYTDAKERLPVYGMDGPGLKKSELVRRKNDEELEEPWVACDGCNAWVHQICGLFNKGRNTHATNYLCPDCLIASGESGQRSRIEARPQSMLESKDLPPCDLSRFLEDRLAGSLARERQCRAARDNKPVGEVATADGLTVRVVNNVMKKAEVKPRFAEAFGGDGYPAAFPYRQRVLLLFQQLDGVDVCLFCMYVQEYGADCPAPNTNCVYLSYLDSVKYFRPEINAALPVPTAHGPSGTALRTYVYHQLLIGYLAYVKSLGFTQMYIWACPPMQGDDYILYCHPHKQKTPRSDRLRAWYLEMLRGAKAEGIVCHLSTLWDTYFPGGRDHRRERCSATTIPYLEGDYWPGEAENQLATLSDAQRQANKASGAKGAAAARAAKGKRFGGGPASMDEVLMERLGEVLGGNMKEDFIVVHMQEVCTFCQSHTPSGGVYRYRAQGGLTRPSGGERKFEGIKLEGQGPNVPTAPVTMLTVCDACYVEERVRGYTGLKPRLPPQATVVDLLYEPVQHKVELRRDSDPEVENEFFDTRQSFLSLCQGNHYQFDTLRRAKHSSMMVLYHLHNPAEPAFSATCNLCNKELEAGTGFRCTVCQDYDICPDCYNARGHEHPVVPSRQYDETRMRMSDTERRQRNESLARTLALVVHACECENPACPSMSCRKVRALFHHVVTCQQRVQGGCTSCKKMYMLLHLHAKSCHRPDCPVPQCRDLKEMRRHQTARQEEQRRLAYQKMLRNQHMLQQQAAAAAAAAK